jgi:hypothetical protein
LLLAEIVQLSLNSQVLLVLLMMVVLLLLDADANGVVVTGIPF